MPRAITKARRQALIEEAERMQIERDGLRRARRLMPAFRRQLTGAIRDFDQAPMPRVLNALEPIQAVLLDVSRRSYTAGYQRTVANAAPKMRKSLSWSFQLEDAAAEVYAGTSQIMLRNVPQELVQAIQTSGQAVYNGTASIAEGTADLKTQLAAKGFGDVVPHVIETWVTTSTQLAYSAGRWQGSQSTAIADILWGWHYVTMGDERVRDEHAGYDGTKLPKDDPFWAMNWPPNGWNCRCTTIEIFDTSETVDPHAIKIGDQEVMPSTAPEFAFNPAAFILDIAA